MTHAEVQSAIDNDITSITSVVYARNKPPLNTREGESHWEALGRVDDEEMAKGNATAVVFHRFYSTFGPGQLVRTSFVAAQALTNWLCVARPATEEDLAKNGCVKQE